MAWRYADLTAAKSLPEKAALRRIGITEMSAYTKEG
jgi:hypothetical protein